MDTNVGLPEALSRSAGPPPSSTRPPGRPSLMERALIWAYTYFLIVFSVGMFMMSSASTKVGDLINAQNDAALKMWVNLDYYSHVKPPPDGDQPLPPGLFDSVVAFSRANASIMKTVHRLRLDAMFSDVSISEALRDVRPTDGKTEGACGERLFDHVGVDPRANVGNIVCQGMYQIELYQAIRDYAQDKSAFYTEVLSAVTAYVLPVLYAQLGAWLRALRASSRQAVAAEGSSADPPLDWTVRLLMAAIIGIAISVLGSILPKDALLSPLAVAFVCGYSIEAFTARLDRYIEGFSGPRKTMP